MANKQWVKPSLVKLVKTRTVVKTCQLSLLYHLLRELSWLAEGRSCVRLESAVELCALRVEGKWEEGAEGPLALIFIDDDSGFGVEEADEAERMGKTACN